MLFTAPAFAFLFLPLSLLFYIIFGKKQKKVCFLIISIVYYVLLNMDAPQNIAVLPVLLIYSFFAQITSEKYSKKWLTILLCCVPFVGLVGLRTLVYMDISDFTYPVGITIPILLSISYIWDCRDSCGAGMRFFRMTSYITFFPLMILGPFLPYNDFCRISDDENISFDLSSVADGARLYMIGFVKRIAVGAVLVDAYQRIFAYSWDTRSFGTLILLLILIYFGVFFSVLGYYDMGVGISRMFGFAIPEVNTNPFSITTVNEYSNGLFGSIRDWVRRYVLYPLFGDGKAPNAVRMLAYCVFTVAIVRSDLVSLILSLPLFLFAFLSSLIKIDGNAAKHKMLAIKMLLGMVTMLAMGTLFVFITMGNGMVFEGLTVDFGNAEYQTDMILISFSWLKYLVVIALGVCTVLPLTQTAQRRKESLSPAKRALRDYASMSIMIVIFFITVIFFLPQFEIYSIMPFSYIVV